MGEDYHKNPTQITEEFKSYAKLFIESTGKITNKHKKMLLAHKQKLNGLTKEVKGNFVAALGEVGILPK